jgi:predicted ATPase
MWLAHLSQLVEPDELDGLRRQVQGMQSERMLREVAEALTVITQETLVVLVLEDLQWSDSATVETLSYLARRPEPLRLLVIGTYRPAEVIVHGHPLRQTVQELMAHRLCQELPLELLTQEQVQAYVTQRLGSRSATSELGAMIYRRTEGNALFTVHLLDHLLQQGWLVDAEGQWRLRDGVEAVNREVPEGLRALLLKQMENLDVPAQQVLAAASVSGMRFTTAEVAAVLQRGVEKVEAICDALTRQSAFIAAQALVTWPDGTVTARYGFRHVRFSEVFYEQLGMAHRARWHRLVGERLESGYGIRARELAGVLSLHFERGQDVRRAVQYQQYGAEQALSRHAYPEAMGHCQRGLELLAPLPESPERATQELGLRLALSNALTATQGYTSEALVDNLHRTLALCQAAEAATEQVRVLVGLTRVFMMRADRAATERLMARERMLLSKLDDATSLVQLHMQLGTAETFRGAYAHAQVHLSHLLNLYDPEAHQSLASAAMIVTALAWSGWCLWLTGYPDQADEQVSRAQAHAEALTHPFSLAFALNFVALVRLGRGEFQAAVAAAQEFTTLAREYGFAFFEAMGTMLQGSALAHGGDLERGMSLLTTGLAQYRHLGCQAFLPFFLTCLAETHLRRDQVEEGLSAIREAVQLTWTNFDSFWAPEVYRLRGDLLLAQAGQARLAASLETATAEACLQQALDMARQQGAKALELRAAMSLSRLWLAQDKPDAAQEVVAELYNGFTGGLDTADLQTAKDLLERCRYTPESSGRPHLF